MDLQYVLIDTAAFGGIKFLYDRSMDKEDGQKVLKDTVEFGITDFIYDTFIYDQLVASDWYKKLPKTSVFKTQPEIFRALVLTAMLMVFKRLARGKKIKLKEFTEYLIISIISLYSSERIKDWM